MMDKKQADELIAEMRSIKKLLILQLMRADASQKQIAAMLEISEATMSRMIPKGTSGKSHPAKRMPQKGTADGG